MDGFHISKCRKLAGNMTTRPKRCYFPLFLYVGDSHAVTSHSDHRSSLEVCAIFGQDHLHERNTPGYWNVGQPDQSAMRRPSKEYHLPKIHIQSDEDALLVDGPLQEDPVTGIGTPFPRFEDLVSLLTQPVREATASAPVDEESHLAPT